MHRLEFHSMGCLMMFVIVNSCCMIPLTALSPAYSSCRWPSTSLAIRLVTILFVVGIRVICHQWQHKGSSLFGSFTMWPFFMSHFSNPLVLFLLAIHVGLVGAFDLRMDQCQLWVVRWKWSSLALLLWQKLLTNSTWKIWNCRSS